MEAKIKPSIEFRSMLPKQSIAAATAVVGYDLAKDTVWQRSSKPRVLRGVGVCGSAAGADTKIDIMIDTVKVGEAYNVTTGLPTQDHVNRFSNYVPPNADFHLYVTDAPVTNPINVLVQFDEIPAR